MKIGSDQNPTLLHVAARAAIKFKDQTYVALVAILSVLVNFNKTLHHSMDDDTSFALAPLQPLYNSGMEEAAALMRWRGVTPALTIRQVSSCYGTYMVN